MPYKTLNIDIYLDKLSDLTDKYDKNKLSDELSKSIYNKCFGTPVKHNIILNIICNFKLTNKDKNRIKDMIRHNYGIHVREHLIHLKYNNLRALFLSIIGLILICISKIINKSFDFIGEVLLIIGWVVFWEASYNYIFYDSKRRIKIKRFKKLTECKINFKD